MSAMLDTIEKGNVVTSRRTGNTALVLAITKDRKRAKLHVYGSSADDIWRPVNQFTVTTADREQCWKCMGSGLFYMGGAVVNGRYTGKTGPCFACEGKGEQDNADRIRCHYYWHRGRIEERPRELPAESPTPAPEPTPEPAKPAASRALRRDNPNVTADMLDEPTGIDCKQCGCYHRSDVSCPWGPGRTR